MTLLIESTRSELCESTHVVHAAVTDASGRTVAHSGDPSRVTYWRSSAKPFQALPLVRDGAAERFGWDDEMLALACASHSSEPVHILLVEKMLASIGCEERDLACGPHTPLSSAVAKRLLREGREPTPLMSNCSGKHTGMLALARHHGFATAGYERAGHPVQARILEEVKRFTHLPDSSIHLGKDGCTAVCFATPLTALAAAYARFATANDSAEKRLREAMWSHPLIVAGTGRFCSALMGASRGDFLAKVGADGVYGAALPTLGLGIALKVEDGDGPCSPVALLSIIAQLFARFDEARLAELDLGRLSSFSEAPIRTTRGEAVGVRRATGTVTFT